MSKHLKLLTSDYLQAYADKVNIDWFDVFNKLRQKNDFSRNDFLFYFQSSATYSSNIEGNSIDFDSYLKNKKFKIKSKPKEKKWPRLTTLLMPTILQCHTNSTRKTYLKRTRF